MVTNRTVDSSSCNIFGIPAVSSSTWCGYAGERHLSHFCGRPLWGCEIRDCARPADKAESKDASNNRILPEFRTSQATHQLAVPHTNLWSKKPLWDRSFRALRLVCGAWSWCVAPEVGDLRRLGAARRGRVVGRPARRGRVVGLTARREGGAARRVAGRPGGTEAKIGRAHV